MAVRARAPWYFRRRAAVFGCIYGASFFFGFMIAGVLGVPAQPTFISSNHPQLLASLALLFAFGGYALRLWASSYIAASIVWTQDVQLGELRVSGPFRFTRNPLYLGNILQGIGVGMLGPWPVTVLLGTMMLAYVFVLISVEEPFLAEKNGASYEAYRARVARFVPLPWKIAPEGGQAASLRDGLRSEIFTACVALLVFVWVLVSIARVSAQVY